MTNNETIIKEFEEKFPEVWSSNDGREGYDSEISTNIKQFLSDKIKEAMESVVPEKPKRYEWDYKEGIGEIYG